MRSWVLWVVLMIVTAGPASAGAPIDFRAFIGVSPFSAGGWENQSTGGLGGMIAADLAWRADARNELVLSYEYSGAGIAGTYELATPLEHALHEMEQEAVLIGLLRCGRGNNAQSFAQVGIGWGRVAPGQGGAGYGLGGSEYEGIRSYGPAVGGSVGFRLIPEPGPLGFLLALRTSNVMAPRGSAHVLAFLIGLTVHPR